jgi:hypothetical protein
MQITKCEITVSVYILEGANRRASGIRDYFPQLLKHEDFFIFSSMLKELCCVSEAPLFVLKLELQFIRGDLGFPRE